MDIIGILDQTGTEVVSYTYDSWGKIISIDGSQAETVGEKNPYRYRGYRYDEETGLYYLQSRYYNPQWGRFVNSDDLSILEVTKGELLSHNLYSYCGNDPMNKVDPSGHIAFALVGALVLVPGVDLVIIAGTLTIIAVGLTIYVGSKIYTKVNAYLTSKSKKTPIPKN